MQPYTGRCPHLPAYGSTCLFVDGFNRLPIARTCNAVGKAESAYGAPRKLPDLVRGAPNGAEALGAVAKVGFVEVNADGDDFVRGTAQAARPRGPVRRVSIPAQRRARAGVDARRCVPASSSGG